MKNKKIVLKIIMIAGIFFAGYNFSLAAGEKCGNGDLGTCQRGALMCWSSDYTRLYGGATSCQTLPITYVCCVKKSETGGLCGKITGGPGLVGSGGIDVKGVCQSDCGGARNEITNPGGYFPQCASGLKCCTGTAVTTNTTPNTNATANTNTTANTNATAGAGNAIDFPNPVGANNLLDLVGNIMNGLRSVIVVIAIVFIVIGGIMYMSSAGSEKMIDRAKSIISGALIGLAIVLAAPTFLKEIIKILGENQGGDPNAVISNALTVYQIAVNVLNFLLSVAGVLAIIGLVVGGVFYFTSYGDEERIEKGKKIISASLIGIAITLAAVLIVKQIMNLMGMA